VPERIAQAGVPVTPELVGQLDDDLGAGGHGPSEQGVDVLDVSVVVAGVHEREAGHDQNLDPGGRARTGARRHGRGV